MATRRLPGRTVAIRLDDEYVDRLVRIAESIAGGSKSRAVEGLIDLHGGKALEAVVLPPAAPDDPPFVPREVVQWRAPKLSVELIAYCAGIVRSGNMPEVAFQLASVPPRLSSTWLKRGRNDRAADRESLYADLVTAIERAEAECEAEDIYRLREHGRQTWTALAWRLERQYPDRYAQRKRIDGKVEHSMLPMIDWDRLTAAETRTLVELLRKGSPEPDEPGLSRTARPALELVPADVIELGPDDVREEPAGGAG